jgi:hypothetical protein
MAVRAIWRLAFGLVLLLGAILPGHAFISGVWQGGPDTDEDGRFIDCTMTAQSGSGILLAFVISRERAWGLALADERWELNVGTVQDIELKIDSGAPVKAVAKVVDRHGILVPLANDDQLVAAIRQGKLLTISTKTGTFSFELSGTSGALAALAACVAENLAAEKAKSASEVADKRPGEVAAIEPSPSAVAQGQSQRLFTVSEASAFAAELLTSAGVTNYRLIDAAENPMPSFDVVFAYPNGIVGAIAGFKAAGAVDLDQAATTIIADDAKNCRGSFGSGAKESEGADPAKVRRLFTTCRFDGKLVEIHYLLIETDGGNLIEIAHLNRGDASLDIASADSAFLKAAALKKVK